jgi:hypothetical protein
MVVCQKSLNVVGVVKITPNGFGLAAVGGIEVQMFILVQMFNSSPNAQFSTNAPILANPCYRLFFFSRFEKFKSIK